MSAMACDSAAIEASPSAKIVPSSTVLASNLALVEHMHYFAIRLRAASGYTAEGASVLPGGEDAHDVPVGDYR